MAINIACCGYKNWLKAIADSGLKYVEFGLNWICEQPEEEFAEILKVMEATGLKCLSTNGFFPWEMRLVGEERDEKAMREYLEVAVARLKALGVKVAVLGCGGGRKITDEVDEETVRRDFGACALLGAEMLADAGVKIAIESLNSRECNFLTTVKDTAEYVRELRANKIAGLEVAPGAADNIGVLADFYHMRMDEEPMANLECAGDLLFHTHIARNKDRKYPQNIDEDLYVEFFATLKKIGYDGLSSIEGNTSDENIAEDVALAAKVLSGALAQA